MSVICVSAAVRAVACVGGACRLQAITARAKATGRRIKQRFQPSFSLIARFILRAVLMMLICVFAPFLLLFALFHDWLMKKFINYAYIYNVSWEDPRMDQQVRRQPGREVDYERSDGSGIGFIMLMTTRGGWYCCRQVFFLKPDDHIITIASAGCNVLDYIIEGARVTAVDFNACQVRGGRGAAGW